MAADGSVGDEIFEVGGFSDDGSHDDAKGGDADDGIFVIVGEEHIVAVGIDEVFEPIFGDLAAVFAAS